VIVVKQGTLFIIKSSRVTIQASPKDLTTLAQANVGSRICQGARRVFKKFRKIGERLGIDGTTAVGLIQGKETLLGYAQVEFLSDGVQEERASVRVALQSVRPVLQARVQRRLDQLDQEYAEAW